jgi:fluoride exporter
LNPAASVMVGGAAGTLARAGVAELIPHSSAGFPVSTLLVNLIGTAILARLVAAGSRWHPLLGTGFCGALTTFSTFQVELVRLVDLGHTGIALGYAAVSLPAGLATAALFGRRPA